MVKWRWGSDIEVMVSKTKVKRWHPTGASELKHLLQLLMPISQFPPQNRVSAAPDTAHSRAEIHASHPRNSLSLGIDLCKQIFCSHYVYYKDCQTSDTEIST